MEFDEASWNRIARVIGGVALIGGGLSAVTGGWVWALAAAWSVLAVAGIVGWCPYPCSVESSACGFAARNMP